MDKQALLDGLTEDILAYVMTGRVSDRAVANGLKPDGLDERFDDFRLLVDLHFILRDDVIEFVRVLPQRLRQLETSTHTRTRSSRGAVRGRVNWQRTFQRRQTESPGDRSLFVCDTRTEQYDTDENLVLKHLLAIIHDTLDRAETYLGRDYPWVTESWGEHRELIDEFQQIFERNVHIRRIREPSQYEPTERMVTTAESSRQELYRRAARLVRAHRDVHALEPDAVRNLIEQTAITPDDEARLLELFVLFRYIRTIENLVDGRFKIQTISSNRQEVARITGNTEIVVYHDTSASDRGLSFRSVPEEKSDDDLSRTEYVQEEARRVAETYFDREFNNHTGRPDVIVLEIRKDEQRQYLVTEVKNSTNVDTIRSGIKETLEYLAFLRQDGSFVFGDYSDESFFGDGWNGLLVIQDLEGQETTPLDEQETIRILQASEVDEQLEQVLERIL